MEIKKPSIIGIVGLVLALVGLYLFLDLNVDVFSYMSMPDIMEALKLTPLIGGILLGIGMAMIIYDRNPILTGASFILFSALAFKNLAALGFGFGIIIPGLFGAGKHLPVYLATLMVFLSAFITVSQDPALYQDVLLSRIADKAMESMSGLGQGIADTVDQAVNSMLPSKSDIEAQLENSMPCNDSATQEICLQARNQLVDQVYNQIHSGNYSDVIREKLAGTSVSEDDLKNMIRKVPLISSMLDNIQWVIATLEAGMFIFVASILVNISQGITAFFLDLSKKLIGKKEEKPEEEGIEE